MQFPRGFSTLVLSFHCYLSDVSWHCCLYKIFIFCIEHSDCKCTIMMCVRFFAGRSFQMPGYRGVYNHSAATKDCHWTTTKHWCIRRTQVSLSSYYYFVHVCTVNAEIFGWLLISQNCFNNWIKINLWLKNSPFHNVYNAWYKLINGHVLNFM